MKKATVTVLVFFAALLVGGSSVYAADLFSADFNGTTQWLKTAFSGITVGGNVTIEGWMQVSAQPGANVTQIVMVSQNNGTTPFVNEWIEYSDVAGTKELRFAYSKACVGTTLASDSVTLAIGAWHHVALTYNGTNLTGYLDGTQVAQVAASGSGSSCTTPTEQFSIGALDDGSGAGQSFFNGKVDEVRVWSIAESATTINNQKCSVIGSATSLQGSWHLDNSLSDSSGNAHTLTNVGTTVLNDTDIPSCLKAATNQGFWTFWEHLYP